MKKAFFFSVFFSVFFVFAGCSKTPVNDLVNPTAKNSTGIWSGQWVIYDDELKTNGAVMLYTEGVGLNFNCANNPHSGSNCIQFSWNGLPVLTYASLPSHPTDYIQSGFTGFGLICAPTVAQYFTATRNLSLGGYTKITFWARGSLSVYTYLLVEANFASGASPNVTQPGSGTGYWMGTVTSGWQQYTISIDNNTNNLSAATDFVKIIMVYDPPSGSNSTQGNGGTVYIDDIQLSK
jgi:hypothetical protein